MDSSSKELMNIPLTEQETTSGLIPPYITIHSYLNFYKPPNPHYRNISFLLEISYRIDPVLLKKTVDYLLRYHDILRSRFIQENNEWRHIILNPEKLIEAPIKYIDLSFIIEDRQKVTIETIAHDIQASLDLSKGPLFQIVYIDLGFQNPGRLLFVFHHVLLDGYSKQVLLEDFMTIYMQLSKDESVRIPRKGTSFKQWAERINNYAQAPERLLDMDYWLSLPWKEFVPLPLDYDYIRHLDTVRSTESINGILSIEETGLLLNSCNAAKISLIDVLLTALTLALAQWTKSSLAYFGIMNHARGLFNDLNVLRTVGFFSLVQDMLLVVDKSETLLETVQKIKKQIANIPSRGFSMDILSYLSKEPSIREQIRIIPRRQVLLNYAGHIRQRSSRPSFYKPAQESIGPEQDPQNLRFELIYITCVIVEEQFRFSIYYSKNFHKKTTIEKFANYFTETIQKISI